MPPLFVLSSLKPSETLRNPLPLEIAEIMRQTGSIFIGSGVGDWRSGRLPNDWDLYSPLSLGALQRLYPQMILFANGLGGRFEISITVEIDDRVSAVNALIEINTSPGMFQSQKAFSENLAQRDFRCNTVSCDAEGNLYDLLGGLDDLNRNNLYPLG